MKKIFERLLAAKTLPSESVLQYWRERILAATLLVAAVLGTIFYGINLITTIQNQDWLWASVYTVAFFVVLTLSFSTRLAYRYRAGSVLMILFFLGLLSAYKFGPSGNALIWLVSFSILAGFFLGLPAGFGATFISVISFLTLGLGISRDLIPLPVNLEVINFLNIKNWIWLAVPLAAIGIWTVLSLNLIVNGLNSSFRSGQRLSKELEEERDRLKRRIGDLEQREVQVRSAAEINRIISAELNPDTLFTKIVDLVQEKFNLYYVGVYLADENNQFAVLRAGTGEAGKKMIAEGHKLPIQGKSMIGRAISHQEASIALDVGIEAVWFDNPNLPNTRSELTLPMISGSQVIGAITVQSDQPKAFDEIDISVFQSVADGLAVAIVNARLFHQTESSLAEIHRLSQQSIGEAWENIITWEENLRITYDNPQKELNGGDDSSVIERPIILHGNVIGNVTLEGDRRDWTLEDNTFIDAVLAQAALSLENVRLTEETQKSALHDRLVADISSQAWETTNIDTILRLALREIVEMLQASTGYIQLDIPDSGLETNIR